MPLTYCCELCEHTASSPLAHIEHAAGHGLTLTRRDVPRPTFTTQVEAQGGRQFLRPIACRSCGRDTARSEADPIFHHCDDGTVACVDPDTLRPYPSSTQPKEKPEMTRIRPTTNEMRDWYGTLSDEQRTAVRASVSALVEQGTAQGEAWAKARAEHAAPPAPVFDPVPHDQPAVRTDAGLDVFVADLESAAAQLKQPDPTPEPAAKRPRRSGPQLVSFWLDGKPRRNLSDLAYDATGGMVPDAPRMTAAQFREYLTEQGIAEPAASAWTLTLPNGKTVSTTLRDEAAA